MIVELKNKNIFMSILSIFKNKDKINLSINKDSMLLESIALQKYYINIPNTIFNTSESCNKFTINPKYLYDALILLDTNNFEVNIDQVKVYTSISYIKIPFTLSIHHQYEEILDIYTKFVVTNKVISIFSNMAGLVKYEIEDTKLFIRKIGKEAIEEIEIKKLSFIETGELSFCCSNEWTDIVHPVLNFVDNVLFLFSANVLCLQFLFKNEEKIYFEIQVPRSLIE